MLPSESSGPSSPQSSASSANYVVVARRYRPQTFQDLVGQQTVSAALGNAIRGGRVGHAYLFTGARGVGKTSTARIFAKALNCEQGPTTTPCNECDICQSIAAGEDVDVLEIDGASNRGIDEIRQLRSNVGVRPGRSRYKIYIIDEVHMLTREAFNALLKTLEEPPEHVKFIFCTTDPEKIPITVLSRCQRFDFPPVESGQIVQRLREIVQQEGAEAEEEALQLLARRAAGSMRDSQSLLEQVLSLGGQRITVELVHRMLGTASIDHLENLVAAILAQDAAAAIGQLDSTLQTGVDAGQLAEQLLVYLRDLLVLAVGGSGDLLLIVTPGDLEKARGAAERWGVETMLAAVQILDQTITRMRRTIQPRVLLEVALVRLAHLSDLDQLSVLIQQLQGGAAAPPTTGAGPGAQGLPRPQPPSRTDPDEKKKSDLNSVVHPPGALEGPHLSPGAVSVRSPVTATAPGSVSPSSTAAANSSSTTAVNAFATNGADDSLATTQSHAGSGQTDSRQVGSREPTATPARTEVTAAAGGTPPGKAAAVIKHSAESVAVPSSAKSRTGLEGRSSESGMSGELTARLERPSQQQSAAAEGRQEQPRPASSPAPSDSVQSPGDLGRLVDQWPTIVQQLDGMLADCAGHAERVAIRAPNRLVLYFPARYNTSKSFCERPERRKEIEDAVSRCAGAQVVLEMELLAGERVVAAPAASANTVRQRQRELQGHPWVQVALQLFGAEIRETVVAPERREDVQRLEE